MTWTVTVTGTPVPKPDPKCFGRGDKHQLSIPASPRYGDWRGRVTTAGQALRGRIGHTITGPVRVSIVFEMPRPASHFGTGRNANSLKWSAPQWPSGRVGDTDKLTRLVLDALTDAHVWDDDCQVVDQHSIKTYPPQASVPGATITVEEIHDEPVF